MLQPTFRRRPRRLEDAPRAKELLSLTKRPPATEFTLPIKPLIEMVLVVIPEDKMLPADTLVQLFSVGEPSSVVVLFESEFKVVVKVVDEGAVAMLKSSSPLELDNRVELFESCNRRLRSAAGVGRIHRTKVKLEPRISGFA